MDQIHRPAVGRISPPSEFAGTARAEQPKKGRAAKKEEMPKGKKAAQPGEHGRMGIRLTAGDADFMLPHKISGGA